MKNSLHFLMILLFSMSVGYAQIITEWIDRNETDLPANAKVDHEEINFNNHGKVYSQMIYYNNNLKPTIKQTFENSLQTSVIKYEYDSIGRIIRQERRWKSTLGPQGSVTAFVWSDDYHAISTEYSIAGNFVNRSEIELNDKKQPVSVLSYGVNDKFVSKETAIYDYDYNLVQIFIYNDKVELTGITITNILKENIKINFEAYLKAIDITTYKPLCKNWTKFGIVMWQFTFKKGKDNHWKSYKDKRLQYEPYSGKYFSTDNQSADRKVVYKK